VALVAVFAALVLPDRLGALEPTAFVALPLELLAFAALVLVLPVRPGRVVAAVLGVLLGLLTVLGLVDIGFRQALGRPFDPVLDAGLLGAAVQLLVSSPDRWVVIAAGIGAVLVVAGIVVGLTAAALRLSSAIRARRRLGTGLLTAGLAAWLALSVTGVQLLPDRPVATAQTSASAVARAVGIADGLADRRRFDEQAGTDAYADVPGSRLLTGLRGKDVMLVFVESYGRSAVEDPGLDPRIDRLLDDGTRQLAADGFGARSAYLTSSTVGGGSWWAESSVLSGLWIDSQARYRELTAGHRLTLTGAFGRAGWDTVAVEPGTSGPWPEAGFFGYQQVADQSRLGYRGPSFSWAAMPDQYTLAWFQRNERKPGHPPLMAVIPLVSSHAPWAPIPRMIDWSAVGDGSAYDPMSAPGSPPEAILTRDPAVVRADYAAATAYSLQALISYVRTYGDDNLVLVFLGDHQPSPIVTGDGASRDVPITIVARDPAVLARTAGWDWTPGLRPARDAPVWRMDAFRDRFLAAFGSRP
jgi:hypothetical protein